jgi:hypothetical protein
VRGEGGEDGVAGGALVVAGCGGGAEAIAGDLGGRVRCGMGVWGDCAYVGDE